MGKKAEDGTSPFWGRAGVMGVRSSMGHILEQNSIELPTEGIPLMQNLAGRSEPGPGDILGVIKHVWYGDESGLQVILFDGIWVQGRDYLEENERLFTPSMFIDKIVWQNDSEGHIVKRGRLRSITLGVAPVWDGLFIRSEPLPEGLRNRGRM